ncbi:PspC domain-containing protein [Actinoplanes sp. NPDC049598]|uniref:PspC domain-containing protein n=1 Tax=Actinoplanes sp. NPDC049598 TaxID=3154626 RepID=UPI003418FFE8
MNEQAAEPQGTRETQGAPTPGAPTPGAQSQGAQAQGTQAPPAPPAADWNAPPWAGGPAFSRDKLVRPRKPRYLAGVSGALARATNTDPVLWRVLFAVLGVISGVGVLLYLIGWLIIPAEGDTASPIESLLGKGRSGMTPVSVVVLGGAAVLSFAFIVQDGVRASLLACAVIFGAIILIKRSSSHGGHPSATAPPPPPAADPFPPASDPFPTAADPFPPASDPFPTAEFATAPTPPPTGPTATMPPPAADAPEPPVEPVTAPMPPFEPAAAPAPPFAPPSGAYRPPFAPHGPFARPTPATYPPAPPAPPAAKKPKKPKERSKLGRLTFFALIVVMGVMALIDTAGANIAVSAYFAAALATIGAGLIVGAWLGRARGLIALGLVTSLGLLAATGSERWGDDVANSVYRPTSPAQIADRYDFTLGDATLDLRQVDFAGQQQTITVTMKFGQVRVILPPTVDTTASLQVANGRAEIFGKTYEGESLNDEALTDLGPDGAGGGTLKLDLRLDAGNLEVHR